MSHRFKVLLFYGVTAITAFFVLYSVFSHSDTGESYNLEAEDAPYSTAKSATSVHSNTTSSGETASSKTQNSELAELTIEIRRLRDSVKSLNNSVKTLTRKIVLSADNTFLVDTAGAEAKCRHYSCRHLNTSKVPVLSADTKRQYALSSVCTP